MTGTWKNEGRHGWEYSGHGWGVYRVKKGGGKWHTFHEPFGAAPVLLGEHDSRKAAQKQAEGIVAGLAASKSARGSNPVNRIKARVGDWVKAHHPRGGHIEGVIVKREKNRAYGDRFQLDSGYSIGVGDVVEVQKRRKKNPAKLPGRDFVVKVESITHPNYDYRATVTYGRNKKTELVSGGMTTVDAVVARLKTDLLAEVHARRPNPKRRRRSAGRKANPSASGYKVFKFQGKWDVRYLGFIQDGAKLLARWFTTAGDAMRFYTKGEAVKAAESAPMTNGWQVGVTPYSTSYQTIVKRLQGKV